MSSFLPFPSEKKNLGCSRSLAVDLVHPSSKEAIHFISSTGPDAPEEKNLLNVTYTRIDKKSPDFRTVHEGFNQSVDMRLSTLVCRAAPEPVIALYDFLMTTFVPKDAVLPGDVIQTHELPQHDDQLAQSAEGGSSIRVLVKLASVRGMYVV